MYQNPEIEWLCTSAVDLPTVPVAEMTQTVLYPSKRRNRLDRMKNLTNIGFSLLISALASPKDIYPFLCYINIFILAMIYKIQYNFSVPVTILSMVLFSLL